MTEAAVRDGSPSASARVGVVDVAAVVLAGLASVVLVLPTYAERPFWFDELVSVEVADAGWSTIWEYVTTFEANMALYHVLLRLWLGVAEGEAGVRALSIGFAVASLPFVYALARRLYDRRTAVVAVFLMSVNVSFVGYSRDARSYALTLLLVTAATYLLARAADDGTGWKVWGLYGVTAALAVWAHLFASLVVVAHLAWLVVERRRGRALTGLTVGSVVIVSLLAPLALALVAGAQQPHLDWLDRPGLEKLPGLFLWFFESRATLIVYFIGGAGALLAAFAAWRRRRDWPRSEILLVLWLLVPPGLAFLASFWTPVYLYRYFLVCLPALVILTAAGFARMRPWWVGSILAAVAVLLSLRTIDGCQPDCKIRRDDWRAAAAYLGARASAEDGVVAYPVEIRTPLDHYLGEDGRPRLIFPSDWGILAARPAERSALQSAIADARGIERIWLVTWWLPADEARELLGRRNVLLSSREFAGNVHVDLYAAPSPQGRGE